VLTVRALSKTYEGARRRLVLRNVDLELRAGEYVAIMGESGIGKSTFLNLLAGLDQPDSGSVSLEGQDLALLSDDARTCSRRSRWASVPGHVLPYLTVFQNVVPLRLIAGCLTAEQAADAGPGERAGNAAELLRRAVARGDRAGLASAGWCWPMSRQGILTRERGSGVGRCARRSAARRHPVTHARRRRTG
jgi:putative ABC transport system ATP-binding protein